MSTSEKEGVQDSVRAELEDFYEKRLFLELGRGEFDRMVTQLSPFYKNKDGAVRWIKNNFKSIVNEVKQGKPPKLSKEQFAEIWEEPANKRMRIAAAFKGFSYKSVSSAKRRYEEAQREAKRIQSEKFHISQYDLEFDQLKAFVESEETVWREEQESVTSPETTDNIERKSDDECDHQHDTKETSFPYGFEFHKDTLHSVNSVRKDPHKKCYECGGKLQRQQGSPCFSKHCIHPNVQRSPQFRLNQHDHCLVVVDDARTRICGCCAWFLSQIDGGYCFPSGNRFAEKDPNTKYRELRPLWNGGINGDNLVLFAGKPQGQNVEHYFYEKEKELLTNLKCKESKIFIKWNNNFRDIASRFKRRHHRRVISVPLHEDNKDVRRVEVQFLKSEYNGYVSSWIAIDGIDVRREFDEAMVRMAWDNLADKDRKMIFKLSMYKKFMGMKFGNTVIKIIFFQNSYKVVAEFRVMKAMGKKARWQKLKKRKFTLFEIENEFTNEENSRIYELVQEYNRKLNVVIKAISEQIPDLYMYKNVQFNCNGMGAILVYHKDQTPHIDTENVMDLQAKDRADSSLWMKNVEVNAVDVVWNEKQEEYDVVYDGNEQSKVFCLEDENTKQCLNGHQMGRHLFCRKDTCMCAIVPDVAVSFHRVHQVTGWTVVYTNRGLSEATKQRAWGKLGDLFKRLRIKQ